MVETAQTCLFVPNYPSGREGWRPLIARAPAGWVTRLVELPDLDAESGSVVSLDEQERTILDAVQRSSYPVTLVGHSLSSYLVARVCSCRPAGLARAVMLSGFARLPTAIVEQHLALATALEQGAIRGVELRQLVHDLVIAPDSATAEDSLLIESMFLAPEASALARFIRRGTTASGSAGVRAYDTPSVVIHGTEDRATPFSLGEELASLGSCSRLVPLDGTGHLSQIFQAERVAHLVYESE